MNTGIKGSAQAIAQGIALQRQGDAYEAILRQDPRRFDALQNLGLIRLQQEKFSDAAGLFRRAAKIDKKSAAMRHLLAIALSESDAKEEAVEHYRTALALQPGNAGAHKDLGYVLHVLGRHQEAAEHCRKALAIKPGDADVHNVLGNALHALKRHAEAVEQYRHVVALCPNAPGGYRNLGMALSALERHEEAITHCRRALALEPRLAAAHISLAGALAGLGQMDAAIAQLEKLLAFDPGHVEGRRRLGQTLLVAGRAGAAMVQFNRALATDPHDADALNGVGHASRTLGKIEPAIAAFEKAIAVAPRDGAGYYHLTQSRRFTTEDQHFGAMKKLAGEANTLSYVSQVALHFGLGKIHAELGEYEQSFRHLLQGNSLVRRQRDYQERNVLDYFEAIERVFTPAMLAERRGDGDPSALPIFIIGMPRSGTTLIEQILASHPQVFGAGELRDVHRLARGMRGLDGSVFPDAAARTPAGAFRKLGSDYLHALRSWAPGAERITDKMPDNFLYTGLIHLALPNARIIHLRRDPRDVGLSCFSQWFEDGGQYFSYDLIEIGCYIRAYQKLMAHWRAALPAGAMLEVDYEEIVGDLEGQARRILDYCGLPWDDAVLSFHATERVVQTASMMQVRQPIYSSSVGRWRHYERQLQPLLEILQAPRTQGTDLKKSEPMR
jgi:tetratricopeptide (TPR) repeat protein